MSNLAQFLSFKLSGFGLQFSNDCWYNNIEQAKSKANREYLKCAY